MGIEQPMLLPKSHAGDSTKNPVQWDTKKDLTKDIIIANFEALGLNGAVFTAGKSGKMPYGQIKKYFRGNDVIINPGTPASLTSPKTENLQFYYQPDHLGSSNYITDASGEVYQHQEYFPFGETFVEERNDAEYTTYLFNGKELDEETGLYYCGARYYDPRVSMWYGVDPLAENFLSLSSYAYVANNPVILFDPDGKFPVPVHASIVEKALNGRIGSIYLAAIKSGATVGSDYINFALGKQHFDNMKFSQIQDNWKFINNRLNELKTDIGAVNKFLGGYDAEQFGEVLHAVADFYAHSNYIEVYLNYYKSEHNGGLPNIENIPTYEEAMKDSKFAKRATTEINTTVFDLITDDNDWGKARAEREGLRYHYDESKGSLDKPSRRAIKSADQRSSINLYEAALKVAEKDVQSKADAVIK